MATIARPDRITEVGSRPVPRLPPVRPPAMLLPLLRLSTVSPQQGYYDSGSGYSTANTSNSAAPRYSYGGTSTSPGIAKSNAYSYESSRDSTYGSSSPDTASSGSYPSYGGQGGSDSRYAAGADRWGTGGSTASGYDYAKSGSAASGSSYPSSGSSASPWSNPGPAASSPSPSGSSRYGSGQQSYATAPAANRYGVDKGYVSDRMPSSSLRDQSASAYTGSSSPVSNYRQDPAASSPWSQPETIADARSAYVPGQTGYDPGNTGYKPPSAPTYTSPAGSYTAPRHNQRRQHRLFPRQHRSLSERQLEWIESHGQLSELSQFVRQPAGLLILRILAAGQRPIRPHFSARA